MYDANKHKELWAEVYRPTTVSECLVDDETETTFKSYISSGNVPNIILHGSPGTSKTSLSRAFCNDLNADVLYISGSLDGRKIDTVRTSILEFCVSVSMDQRPKVVLIDEADYMNAESVQPSLRSLMEEMSSNVRFVMTCNYPNKIIEPLRSRCVMFDMDQRTKDASVLKKTYSRMSYILGTENIQFDPKVLALYVKNTFPDIRKIITGLESEFAGRNEITSAILSQRSDVEALFSSLKRKSFNDIRKWAFENNFDGTFSDVEGYLIEKVDNASIAHLQTLTSEYDYRSKFVANREINLSAYLMELATKMRFK